MSQASILPAFIQACADNTEAMSPAWEHVAHFQQQPDFQRGASPQGWSLLLPG